MLPDGGEEYWSEALCAYVVVPNVLGDTPVATDQDAPLV